MADLPVLWHLKVSHYNEKARWALDHKHIPHVRRAVMAGSQARVAKRISGGTTVPVLVLDGEAIGDSTRIVEALERRWPERPLYPADPGERRRALELEDFFDEQLGPYSRILLMHHTLPDPRLMLGTFASDLRGAQLAAGRAIFPLVRWRLKRDYGLDEAGVALAYEKLRAAGERFRSELQPSGHLVGDEFTIADLTLAALVSPVLAPPQFPYPQPQRGHSRLAPVRDALAESGLADWALETYAQWRGESAEVA